MGYLSETPGQLKAVSYVEQMLGEGGRPVRIGGHSKGGNLAVYAAVHCSSGLQDRILAVYSNDGPGFRRDIVESVAYQRVLPKIHTILPESSIVGMLLEHQEAYRGGAQFQQWNPAARCHVVGGTRHILCLCQGGGGPEPDVG